MLVQLVMNAAIALIWMLFRDSFTPADGLIGYVVGLIVIYVYTKVQGKRLYVYWIWNVFALLFVFVREVLLANLLLMKTVLSPRMDISPGILAVPTQLKTPFEKALFAACMTLTPGSISMEFAAESDVIFVHFLFAKDKEAALRSVYDTFEKRIMEVTRQHV